MKILGTKVPAIIDAQLSENAAVMKDLDDVLGAASRTESGILARMRMVIPVWERANTALTARTPAGGPITRPIQGVPHPVVMAKALLDDYTGLLKTAKDKEELLDTARGDLHGLVSNQSGGGDHATTKQVEYQVEGDDADFGHVAPLDARGNALGSFTVAQVVQVRTKVSNSSGTRTSAVRTITREEPL
jgi:hypothetical protein